MNILLVTWVDPWTRSVSTVHKWAAAGRPLGHDVAVYGDPHPELPSLRFTTDLSGFDVALFVIQVVSDFPEMPRLARVLDGIPRQRRIVVDLWGHFNDTIRLEHDFNHLGIGGRPQWAVKQGIAGIDTDPALLAELGVEVRPCVRFDAVTDLIGKARFAPVFHRPLFRHLGFATIRTFETASARIASASDMKVVEGGRDQRGQSRRV